MKTELGVSVAVLAALAAHGKDFDRATLNAMLEKLAASPEPKAKTGPMAMCYAPLAPERKAFDYVCKKCGRRTHYPENDAELARELAFYRDGAGKLRGLGLNIMLDESALCRHCKTLEALKMPTTGVIVAEPRPIPDNKWMRENFGLRIGDAVTIRDWGVDYCRVLPRTLEYWIPENNIDKDGRVTGDDVAVRYVPLVKGRGAFSAKRDDVLVRLESQPGDPEGWVRVEAPMRVKMSEPETYGATPEMIGKFGYEEGEEANPQRIGHLAWVLDGQRTVVDREDVELLGKFMKGERYFDNGSRGPSVSMKAKLPRLRQLLGAPEK